MSCATLVANERNLFLHNFMHIHLYNHLTFRHRASNIQDDRSANLQMLHFIYLFNKYKY
jgi:hypothetical protein